MKYIIFNGTLPVIFPEEISHVDMCNAVNTIEKLEPTSAGFICDDDGRMICHGYSVSLKLDSDNTDADVINNLF